MKKIKFAPKVLTVLESLLGIMTLAAGLDFVLLWFIIPM